MTKRDEFKAVIDNGNTFKGEGYHKGTAAYFIRIGGCDVGCHWCDVKESWDAEKHPPTATERIVSEAVKYSKTIVVTGGINLGYDTVNSDA